MLADKYGKVCESEGRPISHLYHATYFSNLPSIVRYGLDPSCGVKNYDISKDNVVYLAISQSLALSHAECTDRSKLSDTDNVCESGIFVIKIDIEKLDITKLKQDENVIESNTCHFEYHGIIPPSALDFSLMDSYNVACYKRL